MDMSFYIGGIQIPKPSTFRRIIKPIESDRVVLGGAMFTDFIANRREWSIGWKLLKAEDFNTIYNLYLEQYTNATYHTFGFPAYGIDTVAKINITDHSPKSNGVLIENFSLIIKEKNAF